MTDVFEVRRWDGAGRLGSLDVPRAGVTVETPALMPVVNPHLRTVSPARMEELGAQVLITNGYILYGSEDYREQALEEGLHSLYDFSGAIVTDSGSFQLSVYGDEEVDIDTEEILQFQYDIGSDIGTPVDIPTPPDAARERAERELATTQERLELASGLDLGEMLLNAPVQGSTYTDLRERAGADARATGADVFPVGAVVPLLNDYRYAEAVEVSLAAKRGLGPAAPVHLFGAGHPMMFALAAAAGCDLFDSAAYALYARDDRYLTVRSTEHLADLEYLPCSCPVCTEHGAEGLQALDDAERERRLAEHNLHVSFAEMRRVRQAIRAGDLLELVEARARSHPTVLDGYRALLDHADELERTDDASKESFFHLSTESARRPEVLRHHDRLAGLPVEGDEVLLSEGGANDSYDETWRVVPPFGPFPRALSETYPLTAEVPERTDRAAQAAAARGVTALAEANPDVEFTLAHWEWPDAVLATLPEAVTVTALGADEEGVEDENEGTATE
jgi:7-cyano-7-deazaguanine tRNA-ribosyltransferase